MGTTAPVALITGAAKRIGAAIATKLHAQGFNVIIHYGQSRLEAEALVESFNTIRPDSAVSLSADLCRVSEVQQLADKAQTVWGYIDVLVNNASSFYPTPVGEIIEDDWTSLVGSNLKGPLFLSQALAQTLSQRKGAIINMIDMHIDRPLPKHSVYLLAKSGLASLTRSLATELAPHVRVNGIGPGAILWPDRTLSDEEKQALIDTIPLGALGREQDISDTLWFLVNAPYITGQILYVDGGRSLYSSACA
ncbi:MAG: pteridine reductase [Pseudomonadota bacterium]|uniref:pteridine reductase n=1 Tax=unclassified Alteromonas TaxID=2614992 RepID=UPI0019212334|nr:MULTISPECIES: pteridine reductase [unclassified Alteromonas]BCO18704.1 pteridine reductase [Alteromonas sp. KC3]BCO22665.1 pteridine reductase [Alteromonas sp. KC14]